MVIFNCPQAAAEDNGGGPLMRATGTMTTVEINNKRDMHLRLAELVFMDDLDCGGGWSDVRCTTLRHEE